MPRSEKVRAPTTEVVEEKIRRIAEKVVKVADKFFVHPVRLRDVRVPFRQNDLLIIRFREPIRISSTIDYIDLSNDECEAIINLYPRYYTVSEFAFYFKGGTIDSIAVNTNEKIYVALTWPYQFLHLSVLFTPSVRIDEAEVSSKNGVAAKWFSELVDAYKEVSRYAPEVRPLDLYDSALSVTVLDLYVFDKRYTLNIELNRRHSLVRIVPLSEPPYGYSYGIEYWYDLRLKTVRADRHVQDPKSIRSGNMIVAKFPEELLDDLERSLAELFRSYVLLLAVVRLVDYVY